MGKDRRGGSRRGTGHGGVRLEPLPPPVRAGLDAPFSTTEGTVEAPIEKRDVRPQIDDNPGAPLGAEFWTLQFVQAVSLIADAAMLWALLWWTLRDGKATALTVPTVLGPGPIYYLTALPLLGVVSDRLPRKSVLTASLATRATLHLTCAVLLTIGQLTISSLLLCQITSVLATAAFDSACTSTVPKLVRPGQAPRALGYGLALPRAGFFVTAMFCLLLVALAGPTMSLLIGSGFLALATIQCRSLRSNTETENHWPWRSLPKQFVAGWLTFLQTPGVPWLGFLAALANFVVHPLFSLSPYRRLAPNGPSDPAPQESMQLETWLVLGVVFGAVLLQRQLRNISTERIFSASLLWLALGLGILGLSRGELAPVIACVLIGVALTPLAGLTAGVSMLGVADEYRARVSAILTMLFGLGGELGQLVVPPLLHRYGVRFTMLGLAAVLGLLGLLLTMIPTLPSALRSPRNR